MKSSGPNTEPQGTSCERGAVEEEQLLMLRNCCLFVRYDLNQERAVPVMRNDSRQESRMADGVKGCCDVEEEVSAEGAGV